MFNAIREMQEKIFLEFGTKEIDVTIEMPHRAFYGLVDKEFVQDFSRSINALPPKGYEVQFDHGKVKVICHGNRPVSDLASP